MKGFILIISQVIPKRQNLVEVLNARGIVVGLCLHAGSYEEATRVNPDLKSLQVVNRLGFPEIILPGLERHDFYVTLKSAEVSKDNMEISIFVRYDDGYLVDVSR